MISGTGGSSVTTRRPSLATTSTEFAPAVLPSAVFVDRPATSMAPSMPSPGVVPALPDPTPGLPPARDQLEPGSPSQITHPGALGCTSIFRAGRAGCQTG